MSAQKPTPVWVDFSKVAAAVIYGIFRVGAATVGGVTLLLAMLALVEPLSKNMSPGFSGAAAISFWSLCAVVAAVGLGVAIWRGLHLPILEPSPAGVPTPTRALSLGEIPIPFAVTGAALIAALLAIVGGQELAGLSQGLSVFLVVLVVMAGLGWVAMLGRWARARSATPGPPVVTRAAADVWEDEHGAPRGTLKTDED